MCSTTKGIVQALFTFAANSATDSHIEHVTAESLWGFVDRQSKEMCSACGCLALPHSISVSAASCTLDPTVHAAILEYSAGISTQLNLFSTRLERVIPFPLPPSPGLLKEALQVSLGFPTYLFSGI